MKNKLTRLLSLLLIMAFLVSAFAVFSFAEEGDEEPEEEPSTVSVVVNRSFEEGWDTTNGLSGSYKNQGFTVEYEELDDFTYNYFARVKLLKDPALNGGGAFITLNADSTKTAGGTVLEYDIKVDCVSTGMYTYMLTPGKDGVRSNHKIFRITDNCYLIGNGLEKSLNIGSLANGWVHIANVYNFDQSYVSCPTCNAFYDTDESPDGCPTEGCEETAVKHYITSRTYFSMADVFDHKNAVNVEDMAEGESFDLSTTTYYADSYMAINEGVAAINEIRLGLTGATAKNIGQGFLLDNVKLYSDIAPKDENGNSVPMDVREDITVENYGYGSSVSSEKPKTIEIIGSDNSAVDFVANAMMMKIGSDYMLYKEERLPIFTNSSTKEPYGAPVKINGVVYVPFEPLLDVTGFPVFVHEDGLQYDISTADGTSILTLNRSVAIVGGKRIPLAAEPIMVQDPDDPDNTYPVIAIDDLSTFFPGYFVTYDEMGLIGISQGENIFSRDIDLGALITIMKKFIFDKPTEDEMYAMIEENTNGFDHPYLMADQEKFDWLNSVYEAHVKKAAGEEYDETLIDDTLYYFMEPVIANAESYIKKFTTLPHPDKAANYTFLEYAYERDPDKYQLLAFEITNPFYGIREGVLYTDSSSYGWDYAGPPDENGDYWGKAGEHYNDGYDWAGGRNGNSAGYAEDAKYLALAYQITRDMRYAEMAYDIAISLCDTDNWHHWSNAHFLNCSATIHNLALAYDWLYDVWVEIQHERAEEYNLAHITQTIYRRGIYHGYDTSRFGRISEVAERSDVEGVTLVDGYITNTWNWAKCNINWNGVCNTGLVVGSMAIVGEDERLEGVDFSRDDKDGVNRVRWTMANNLQFLCDYGLVQYAPDGSYIEGASYWSYATNYIAQLIWAIKTATGDDLGLYEAWGMDKTFYYAVQSEYSVYKSNAFTFNTWDYNDNAGGMQSSALFFFAADMLKDNALAAIRIHHVKDCGKSRSWTDVLGYEPEYKNFTMDDVVLDLDYRYEACEGIIARSSWDDGHIFAGIMGNKNNEGNHAHMDSGMFTYVQDGVCWFPDIGSDEYNIYKYFDYGYNQLYYRTSAEGHNLVILTSQQEAVPFGQSYTANGKVTEIVSEAAGMYSVIDNVSAYSTYAKYAYRGMLMTNNRQTVVIQDEIAFNGAQSAAWIAHTKASITLSEDKRTAYLSGDGADGKVEYIRVSIVSPDPNLKFEVMTCGITMGANGKLQDALLDGLKDPNYSFSHGGVREKSRDNLRRLVIKVSNTMTFECAVVIEDIYSAEEVTPVTYDFARINTWDEVGIYETYTGSNAGNTGGGSSGNDETITSAKIGDIRTYSAQAKKLVDSGYALDTRITDFFRSLVRVNAAVNTYRPETFQNIPQIWSAYQEYLGYIEYYKSYSASVNDSFALSRNVSVGLTGK